jgi:hypothetical protein
MVRTTVTFLVREVHTELVRGRGADQEHAGSGERNGPVRAPREGWKGGSSCVLLGGADQEGETASGNKERGGDLEGVFEVLDCAEGDDVEASLVAGEIFGAAAEYIDVRQCKRAGYFAEEGGFLVVRFDQREIDVRVPELEGDAGESGAGTDIGQAWQALYHRGHRECSSFAQGFGKKGRHRGSAGEKVACGKEGFAEVASDNLFRIADGGEIDAGIPAEKYIDERRYTLIERVVSRRALVAGRHPQERGEQFGDAGGVHAILELSIVKCNSRF